MKTSIKRLPLIPIFFVLILTNYMDVHADLINEKEGIAIEVEGFRPVVADEADSKIIFESEDEEDDTVIGIDYAVDLGEEDSLIEVKGETDIELSSLKGIKLKFLLPTLAIIILTIGLKVLANKTQNP